MKGGLVCLFWNLFSPFLFYLCLCLVKKEIERGGSNGGVTDNDMQN